MTIRCSQMAKPFYEVPSSSGSKKYRVVLFQDGVLPSCTCTGFMTKRNKNANIAGGGFAGAGTGLSGQVTAWCRHLDTLQKTICQWRLTDENAIPPSACPACGGPVVDDNGKTVVDVSSATNGLLAIVADLTGKQVIDDDPEPEEDAPDDDPLPTNKDAGLINAIVGKEVFAPEPPVGKTDFDTDNAVAELAAMLKGK